MRKNWRLTKAVTIAAIIAIATLVAPAALAGEATFKLGNEVLLDKYLHLLEGKRVGLVTNQSGVNSKGESLIDIFAKHDAIKLTALYGPEHGIDGTAAAGAYVASRRHPNLGIPVHSLYGPTRMPTEEMLKDIDLLVFDVQDIGARSYTYMSTLNYCMVAAKEYGKTIIVLDRPNPVGGETVEGPMMEDPNVSFVGVDYLPMAHGMTAGELALFFNRKIAADLVVIPMEGYTRGMLYTDTGLQWVQTSPNIPDLDSVFGYMATGLGEGTGVFQADKFKWIGGKGLNSEQFAQKLASSGLKGVEFIPEDRGASGGVRLQITDYHSFNPARTGIYALAYAFASGDFVVPKSGTTVVMFDKIMGTNKIGKYLEQKLTPQEIEQQYAPALNEFKQARKSYLIYTDTPKPAGIVGQGIQILVDKVPIVLDVSPFLDANDRLLVPLRAIAEALGAEVNWDSLARTIEIAKAGLDLHLTIGSRDAFLNGEQRLMDTTAVIKNGRTMVPVRFVAEFLGETVHWDPVLKRVDIGTQPLPGDKI